MTAARTMSPWGELYGQLLKAERLERGLTPEQHADNVRHRAEQAVTSLKAAHDVNQNRRVAVLRHPDLAKRLATALGIANAERWNGYVPPNRDGYGRANTSPVRAELVEICSEAYNREYPVESTEEHEAS